MPWLQGTCSNLQKKIPSRVLLRLVMLRVGAHLQKTTHLR